MQRLGLHNAKHWHSETVSTFAHCTGGYWDGVGTQQGKSLKQIMVLAPVNIDYVAINFIAHIHHIAFRTFGQIRMGAEIVRVFQVQPG